jgi:hypothetical protein
MTAEEILYAVVNALESLGVAYMVVGSFLSSLYGTPRMTHDAGLVVEFGQVSPSQVQQRLGPALRLDPQMSFETITGTYRMIATHAASAFKVEFFLLSGDPHDRERFARRRREPLPAREAFVASPEDVVITKLRRSKGGNRKKDIDDARNVIRAQQQTLDWPYVHRWCDAHGTRELLERVRAEVAAG